MPKVTKATKVASKRKYNRAANSISVKSPSKKVNADLSLFQRLQSELNFNMSYVNLALGLFIVGMIGILTFNYFKGSPADLGPAQQTVAEEKNKDVTPQNLPGKYTVKQGDTLFQIAAAYYGDGYKFDQIASANKLANVDLLEVGQVLNLPKLESVKVEIAGTGTGGAVNQTIWGERITGDTYTVAEGDWLSTISGRAYGDAMAFDKIVKANNITNADLIEPGTVLKLPR